MDETIIFTAPNAVDTEFFAHSAEVIRCEVGSYRAKLNLPSHFFVFAGRLITEKGVFDLLEAYKSLPAELRSQWGLVFVGTGLASQELQTRTVNLKVGSVQLAGFAHREQLAAYYALADVFVFPTHTDPWGLVVNEAMACRLPVITSNAAGCAEDLVQDGWNGCIFNAGDVTHLATLMKSMATGEQQRQKMGEHSYERIQQYSPEICANGITVAALSQRSPQ